MLFLVETKLQIWYTGILIAQIELEVTLPRINYIYCMMVKLTLIQHLQDKSLQDTLKLLTHLYATIAREITGPMMLNPNTNILWDTHCLPWYED